MKAETRYKNRMTLAIKGIAKACGLNYYGLAPGGNMRGTPDKMYFLGTFAFMFEKKRKGKAAEKLQSHRIEQLNLRDLPSFWLAADPDSMGANGRERIELLEKLSEFTNPVAVKARELAQRADCKKIHTYARQQLEKLNE